MEAAPTRPTAFVQVDLDGLWAVRRCYGGAGLPEQDDPVYSQALPAALDLFDRLDIVATFFVVGADARVAWKRRHLESVRDRGHEIANHSMSHHLGLGRLEAAEMEREIADCQATLAETLGVEVRGFRAPGYGVSPALIETLSRLGLWYDSSLFPMPWGWVMRWMDRRMSVGKQRDHPQYGNARGGRAPLGPYRPDPRQPVRPGNGQERLWEIPVSVSARCRLPFHGGIGFLLGRRWLRRAVRGLERNARFVNYVMHGIDLVDGRTWDVISSRRSRWIFGGTARERLGFFTETLREVCHRFEVQRTDRWVEHARAVNEND